MKYIVEIDTAKFTKPEKWFVGRRYEVDEVARLLMTVANMLEAKAYLAPTNLYDIADANKIVGEVRVVEAEEQVKKRFKDVAIGTVFYDPTSGEDWRKTGDTTAICLSGGDALEGGKDEFSADDEVRPLNSFAHKY